MKVRARKLKKTTHCRDFSYGIPAWNGLVCYCSTKNEESIKYVRLMKNMSKVYTYTTEFSDEQIEKDKLSSCILCGVGYKLENGILLADAARDDKEVYFVPWKNISCWGRVKFVGNKDKWGAYAALDEVVKTKEISCTEFTKLR